MNSNSPFNGACSLLLLRQWPGDAFHYSFDDSIDSPVGTHRENLSPGGNPLGEPVTRWESTGYGFVDNTGRNGEMEEPIETEEPVFQGVGVALSCAAVLGLVPAAAVAVFIISR